jgi:hypothetical protein
VESSEPVRAYNGIALPHYYKQPRRNRLSTYNQRKKRGITIGHNLLKHCLLKTVFELKMEGEKGR